MSAADPWLRARITVLWAIVLGTFGALALVPVVARAAPPSSYGAGWLQLVPTGELYGIPIAYVPGGEGVASVQFVALSRFQCTDELSWGTVGTSNPGDPVFFPHTCENPDFSQSPSEGFEVWTRALYAEAPEPPASAASGAGATTGDVDRVVRGLQAVLAGLVLAAGIAGFRLGLS